MLTFHAIGDWRPGQVRVVRSIQSSRRIIPEVQRRIDETWARVSARPGVNLFDGPMCRMESFDASPGRLSLVVSLTSYKPFLGTNLHNPGFAETFGRDVMANPVGVSTLLETADGWLMLGVRNASVAYYPGRVHPFAGTLEPDDGPDVFTAAYRELNEELSLQSSDLPEIRCTGLVEDTALLQPELIFAARCDLKRARIEQRLDAAEHDATWAVEALRESVEAATGEAALTPVAVASLLLWGRGRFGEDWFADRANCYRA